MGKPAARAGDWHDCPMIESGSGTPHKGGEIKEPGNVTVLIGGEPAAVKGDACKCEVGLDTIIGGSTGVFIGGKPAARKGDRCAHGGAIKGGLDSVLIGEGGKGKRTKKEDWKEPSLKRKTEIINQAIEICVVLLENKLKLLLEYDSQIFKDLEKWFGRVDKRKHDVILKRIRSTLAVCKDLRIHDFILDDAPRSEGIYGYIYKRKGSRPIIHLGRKFWKIKNGDEKSRAGVIIHELSHFKDIGKADDYTYGVEGCRSLAEHYPEEALYNADSYEIFITG